MSGVLRGFSVFFCLGLLPLSAMGHSENHNPLRHQVMMEQGIPERYRQAENPLTPSQENLSAGQELYVQYCAACHGDSGKGDGPAAGGLDPAPPSIGAMMGGDMMGTTMDGYLLWVLAEGGQPTGSSMPPTQGLLSDEQRWQIIHYVQNGFQAGM